MANNTLRRAAKPDIATPGIRRTSATMGRRKKKKKRRVAGTLLTPERAGTLLGG